MPKVLLPEGFLFKRSQETVRQRPWNIKPFMTRRHLLAISGMLFYTSIFTLASWVYHGEETRFLTILAIFSSYVGAHSLLFFFISKNQIQISEADLTMMVMGLVILYMLSMQFFLAGEYKFLMLLGYANVMAFGFFNLSPRRFFILAISISVGYALASSIQSYYQYGALSFVDIISPIILCFSLLAFAVVGREVAHLRAIYLCQNTELRQALSRIEQLAVTDELTGIYNRRFLLEAVDKQRALALRKNTSFVVAFLDLDHFKQVNDNYSHLIGDEVLKEVADLLKASIREVDIVARYGGEEFVVVLTETNLEYATDALERLRGVIEEQRFSSHEIVQTVSIGAAEFIPGEGIDNLFERADRLLYLAKQGGRNRVEL